MLHFYLNLLHFSAVASMSLSSMEHADSPEEQQKKENILRCYCNRPECVTTGYMCKSTIGCFSDLDTYKNVDRAMHGCLDSLPRERQEECRNASGVPPTHQLSLLLCCHEDICNHVDTPGTRDKYNETIFAVAAVIAARSEKVMDRSTYKSQEVWFKVATIAVPICGALILLMLIALAVRMLRSDSMDDPVLAAKLRSRHCFPSMNGPVASVHLCGGGGVGGGVSCGEKKLPLLFQQNEIRPGRTDEKNLANAKLNCLPLESAAPLRPQPPPPFMDFEKRSDPSECNLYRGVAAPLLASDLPDKLDYKRPPPLWSDNNL